MPIPWLRIIDAVLGVTDLARSRRPATPVDPDQQLQFDPGRGGPLGGLETRHAGVMVAALKEAFDTDFDQMQAGFDKTLDRLFAGLRGVVNAPKGSDLLAMPLEDLRKLAGEQPRSYPVQLVLGHQLRKAGQRDEAMEAFERAAALIPIAQGKESPHAQMAEIALEKKDNARAITELTALVAVDFNNVEAPRMLASLLRQASVDDRADRSPRAPARSWIESPRPATHLPGQASSAQRTPCPSQQPR